MGADGIFNPFKKEGEDELQNYISVLDEEPLDTESNLYHEPPSVTLDGDIYALKFNYANLEVSRVRLIGLFYAVNKHHSKELNRD